MDLRYHTGQSVRHGVGALAEAALVVAIAGALVFGVAVTTGNGPDGASKAFAGGKLSATISFATKAPEPLSVSNPVAFKVTRSVADNTVYWVYNSCWDANNKLLSTEAYPVLWPSYDSLTGGTYPYVFTLSGTHCQALVTIRSWTAKPLGNAVINYTVQ